MAYTTIANGDVPDATVLMANFDFLKAGGGVLSGTLAVLKTAALAAPTVPFLCIATDLNYTPYIYVGVSTVGDAGFIPLGGPAAGPASDIEGTERG